MECPLTRRPSFTLSAMNYVNCVAGVKSDGVSVKAHIRWIPVAFYGFHLDGTFPKLVGVSPAHV